MEELIEALADRIAAKILAKLETPGFYGSAKTATLPPGKSRTWAVRNLKRIPGSRKVGRDWIVSIADWNAWLAEPEKQMPDDADLMMRAERALAANGLRRTLK